MPIPRVTRRNFLSSAALSSAALGWLPRSASAEAPNSSRSEADWFSSQTEWDSASFNHLLRARRTVKQLFDVTAPDGETLTDHVHNALTGLERGFGIPKEKILVVAALRAGATILNFDEMGIYLTQVTPTCSVCGGGRLSARSAGVGAPFLDRGGLQGVSVSTSLAGGILLSALWSSEGMASLGFAMGVRGLSSSNFGDSGDDFSRQSAAADIVVPGGVVGDQPEERRQRHGLTAGAGLEELQDGLDLAA